MRILLRTNALTDDPGIHDTGRNRMSTRNPLLEQMVTAMAEGPALEHGIT